MYSMFVLMMLGHTPRAASIAAELGCGMRVLAPHIRDDLGLEIGVRGQAVLDRRKRPLQCFGNGDGNVRCKFPREDDNATDDRWYGVAGELGDKVLTGDDAVRFFSPRVLIELDVSMWCH